MTTISNEELIEFCEAVKKLPHHSHKVHQMAVYMLAKLQPPLRKIDLSNLDPRVPVRVWDDGEPPYDAYPLHDFGQIPGFGWEKCTLKTNRWVFNDNGTNPWPEGCFIEAFFDDRSICDGDLCDFVFEHGHSLTVSASRYVGPAEGWTE